MKVWTITGFKGHWPVGTAAVVVAENKEHAVQSMVDALLFLGLPQEIEPDQLVELNLDTDTPTVRVLCDGDY